MIDPDPPPDSSPEDPDASREQAVNDAIRSSSPIDSVGFRTETASLGQPSVDLNRSLRLLGILEDRELVRKVSEN